MAITIPAAQLDKMIGSRSGRGARTRVVHDHNPELRQARSCRPGAPAQGAHGAGRREGRLESVLTLSFSRNEMTNIDP